MTAPDDANPTALRASSSVALVLGLPAVLAGILGECSAAALDSASFVSTWLWLLVYVAFPIFSLAWLTGLILGRVQYAWRSGALRAAPMALQLSCVWLVEIFALHRIAERFHNRELAALLVAVVSLGLCAGQLLLVRWATYDNQSPDWVGKVRRLLKAMLGSWFVLAAAAGITFAALIYLNREGLSQLNRWLWITPLATVLVASASAIFVHFSREMSRKYLLAIAVTSALCSWGAGVLRPELPRRLLDVGGWSALALKSVQAATDFDRDGYSSLAGGADCAPFDSKINPGAVDVPGDGIDSNCFAGDSRAEARPRPSWSALTNTDLAGRKLNVLYVSIEALRPDHLSLMGYERPTTPTLSELGANAFVFERAYSPSTLTRWSLSSIFSSLPSSRVLFDVPKSKGGNLHINASVPWFPRLLQEAGYHTAAVVPNFEILVKNGLGLSRGFDVYDDSTPLTYRGGSMLGFPGAGQVKRAGEILDQLGDDKPFFMWVHFVEPHYHYEHPKGAPNFGDDDKDRYDSEIWQADHNLGDLIDGLRERELADDTIIVVTGDHGEEFGEHGQRFHGSNLYEPQVRTLLLMQVPGFAGKRIRVPVCLNEMPTTLLNLLGQKKAFEKMYSRNLVPLLQGEDKLAGEVLVELFDGWRHSDYQAAMIDGDDKVTWSENGNLTRVFDLQHDRKERSPVAEPSPDAVELRDTLRRYIDGSARHPPALGADAPKPPPVRHKSRVSRSG
ncbi:MAG TPA: sulfatase-like hydrolase/transferase [Polyangiaceae bacterium]|jgi:arylsulfatase A-like enzyme|nr:sulfatase-like hydrolase/transferase [Polyangiaceae bacterium]